MFSKYGESIESLYFHSQRSLNKKSQAEDQKKKIAIEKQFIDLNKYLLKTQSRNKPLQNEEAAQIADDDDKEKTIFDSLSTYNKFYRKYHPAYNIENIIKRNKKKIEHKEKIKGTPYIKVNSDFDRIVLKYIKPFNYLESIKALKKPKKIEHYNHQINIKKDGWEFYIDHNTIKPEINNYISMHKITSRETNANSYENKCIKSDNNNNNFNNNLSISKGGYNSVTLSNSVEHINNINNTSKTINNDSSTLRRNSLVKMMNNNSSKITINNYNNSNNNSNNNNSMNNKNKRKSILENVKNELKLNKSENIDKANKFGIYYNKNYKLVLPKTNFNFVNYDRDFKVNRNINEKSFRYIYGEHSPLPEYRFNKRYMHNNIISIDKVQNRNNDQQNVLPSFMYNINKGTPTMCITENSLVLNNYMNRCANYNEDHFINKNLEKKEDKNKHYRITGKNDFSNARENTNLDFVFDHIKKNMQTFYNQKVE